MPGREFLSLGPSVPPKIPVAGSLNEGIVGVSMEEEGLNDISFLISCPIIGSICLAVVTNSKGTPAVPPEDVVVVSYPPGVKEAIPSELNLPPDL